MKSKVLIPVDTGRNSRTSEEYALKLNARMPLKVTLLNVLNKKRLEGRGISLPDQENILAGMRRLAQGVMQEAAEPFASGGVEHEIRIVEGAPGPTICRLAEEEGFDLVLIPPSGLGEWEELLGGSVVRMVLNKCQTPVLLVKHTSERLEDLRRQRAKAGLLPR